jgi:dTDP-4-dehydrorhamnose 3,5-epimerase
MFNRREFGAATGLVIDWVQDCEFRSRRGALRGPHFYWKAAQQYKLVECTAGDVIDVAICVDRASPVYGQHVAIQLRGGSRTQVLVPPGYAHAVLALEDSTVQYKTNVYHSPFAQTALDWDDPELGIAWPIQPMIFSQEKRVKLSEVNYNV